MTTIEAAGIIGRLLQFAAAAVLTGGPLFFLYAVTPKGGERWPMRLVRIAAGMGIVGTLGWLMTQAGQIGDTPAAAFDPAVVWSVGVDTSFGRVAALRLILFLAALLATFLPARRRSYWLLLTTLGAVAAASFAWTGHGVRDEGMAGVAHLAADVLHLLAAFVWIGALAALVLLVWFARREGSATQGPDALLGLVRFSGIGAAVVAALVASGLANSWFLVGPNGLGRMLSSPYGLLLLVKLMFFGAMLILAAANRYRHTPQLERALQSGQLDGRALRPVLASVVTETGLAVAVLVLVSWLGTLSPPIDA